MRKRRERKEKELVKKREEGKGDKILFFSFF